MASAAVEFEVFKVYTLGRGHMKKNICFCVFGGFILFTAYYTECIFSVDVLMLQRHFQRKLFMLSV